MRLLAKQVNQFIKIFEKGKMGIMTKICENIGIRVNLEIYGEKTNSKKLND
jgi:hypothetical protein